MLVLLRGGESFLDVTCIIMLCLSLVHLLSSDTHIDFSPRLLLLQWTRRKEND